MEASIDDVARFVGWVDTPNVRGTVDIIYSCFVVVITAIWTVLHLNIPAKGDTWMRIMKRRARWGILAIFAPDMLTMIAASQWVSAKRSVQQMRELGEQDSWGLEHAFYANSGGFFLHLEDGQSFPVNAECIHFLISRGYIALPKIHRDEIWDKSKADYFAKAFALLQISWMIIQSIARTVGKLSLSPLELFTLAFVVSTVMSYFFWWHKPQHVETPTIIRCEFSTAKILTESGLPSNMSYEDTPLDFIQKATQVWERRDRYKNYDLDRQEPVIGGHQSPVKRVPNDSIMPSNLPLNVLAGLVIPSIIHSCIHLGAWNLAFPSEVEKLLWRISVIILASVSCVSIGLVRVLTIAGYRGKYNLSWLWINVNRESEEERIWPNFWDVLLGIFVWSLVIARGYIIVEVVVSLRHLPDDVYITPNWTNFIPHV
ncbi:hypothetical protein F4810DRAFT_665452 [Camillea tinctor]|nr:hypothetical protein F4810DRAFT_665452 [Camillea tinctor]